MARIAGINIPTEKRVQIALSNSESIVRKWGSRNRGNGRQAMRKVGANPDPIGIRKGAMHRAMTHNRMKASHNTRFLHMSDAGLRARSKERTFDQAVDEYQLQLRVNEDFYEYMGELVIRAGLETKSELVRFALRELDRVRREYDGIKMPDGHDLQAAVADEGNDRRIVPFRKKTAKRRIVVAMRGVAHVRLQRLIEWLGGMPLVDVVAIALGVLDTILTTEEEEIRSSSAKQSAQILTGETAEPEVSKGEAMLC